MTKPKTQLTHEYQAAVDLGHITEADALRQQNGSQGKPTKVEWRGLLRKNSAGKYYGDEANVLHALRSAPELQGSMRYNVFFNRVEVARDVSWREDAAGSQWTDDDDLDVMAYLQNQKIPVRAKGTIGDSIERVAKDNPFHPVREYLDDLEWDHKSRLYQWLPKYLGADTDEEYLAAVGQAFLISAVARIYEPGCQADHVLVISGGQGIGKTRATQVLGAPWTTDSMPDLHSKDAALQMQGVWFVELSELAALRKSEIESIKAFITRRVDRFRPPYGKRTVEIPRQCVFVGTTNESTYLKDPTGNRRFWPVQANDIDIAGLEEDRDKLWAEAVYLYRLGVPWYLTGEDAELAEQEQDHYRLRTEIEQQVAEYIALREDAGVKEITTRQVYEGALGLDVESDILKIRQVGTEVANAIAARGWHKVKERGRGKNRRVVYVKSVQANDESS